MASACFSEDLTCSICLSVFTEPVVLLCGHSFCRECISASLDKQKHCPVCRSPVEGQTLPTNHVLKSLVEKATEKLQYRHDKEKADFLCPEHDEKLKLYCVTDKQLICVICGFSKKHQSHQLKPVSEGAALVRQQLQSVAQQISADTKALEALVQSQTDEENRTKQRSKMLTSLINAKFKEMHKFLKKRECELTDKVKSDEEAGLKKMAEKLEDMEAAISENTELNNMLSSALKIEDHEHFLKKWSEEKKSKAAQSSFKPKAGSFQVEKTELSLEPYESHLQLFVWKEMLQVVTPREEQLQLRKDQTNLMVSGDQRSAMFCYNTINQANQIYDSRSGRYVSRGQIQPTPTQSTTTFTLQHYWEVYVGEHDDWEVGLPSEYMKYNGGNYQICNSGYTTTSPVIQDKPQKIGIYLNSPRKELSFYNADNMKLIHTLSLTSTTFPVSAHFKLGNSSNCHDPLVLCRY